MSKNKMTPAPWHIDAFDLRGILATMSEVNKNYFTVAKCNINRDGSTFSEDCANAAAIVSAINNTYGAGINPEAIPDLLNALNSCLVGMEGEESFPGHNQAYLLQVCLPRAKAAIEKAKL